MASGHQRVPHKQAGHMAAPTSTALPSKHPLPTGSRPHMARLGSQGMPPAWLFYLQPRTRQKTEAKRNRLLAASEKGVEPTQSA